MLIRFIIRPLYGLWEDHVKGARFDAYPFYNQALHGVAGGLREGRARFDAYPSFCESLFAIVYPQKVQPWKLYVGRVADFFLVSCRRNSVDMSTTFLVLLLFIFDNYEFFSL